MIAALLKALDRVIDLLRIQEKRMQMRFDQIWKPTYADLQTVHTDYYAMFQKVHSLLLKWSADDAHVGPGDYLHEAVVFVKEQRVAFAPVRQKLLALKSLADDNARMQSLSEPERVFLACVISYIEGKSFPDYHGTRSAQLQRRLEELARMDDTVAERFVIDGFEERIQRLGEGWISVSKAFNALQIALIQSST